MTKLLKGDRYEIEIGDSLYPHALTYVRSPPKKLYVIGNRFAIKEGLAVVGARQATPYGLSCAYHFAEIAARRGICIISGGAKGCDAQSHRAALKQNAETVVFHGPGINQLYPSSNIELFQEIIDSGGAIVSEHEWNQEARGWMFRERNRLIAGLAKATLIVEAGLPSGTFTTADDAIAANREVMVIPGAITSKYSHGANKLIYQGAIPIIDDDVFEDQLNSLYELKEIFKSDGWYKNEEEESVFRSLHEALQAQTLSLDEMSNMISVVTGPENALKRLMLWLARETSESRLARYPDGNYGALMNW